MQYMSVGQVAVMRDGEPAELEIRVQRLNISKNCVPGGGVAVVSDGDAAGQFFDHPGVAEIVADQSHAAMGVEAGTVEAGDTGGFLAAMLQRMQPQRCYRGSIRHIPHAENPAFFVQGVVIGIPAGEGHMQRFLFTLGRFSDRPPLRCRVQQSFSRSLPSGRRRVEQMGTVGFGQLTSYPTCSLISRGQCSRIEHGIRPSFNRKHHLPNDIGDDDHRRTPCEAEYQPQRAINPAQRRSAHDTADGARDQHQDDQREQENDDEADRIDPFR